MLETLRHRGPDDRYIVAGDRYAIGAARLSIVDVEGGRQPLTNEDGTCEWDNAHPNHYGDGLKLCDLGYDFLTRPRKPSQAHENLTAARAVAAAAS